MSAQQAFDEADQEPVYVCAACDWRGSRPSITDTSVRVEHVAFDVSYTVQPHYAVCPTCFTYVRQENTHATTQRPD